MPIRFFNLKVLFVPKSCLLYSGISNLISGDLYIILPLGGIMVACDVIVAFVLSAHVKPRFHRVFIVNMSLILEHLLRICLKSLVAKTFQNSMDMQDLYWLHFSSALFLSVFLSHLLKLCVYMWRILVFLTNPFISFGDSYEVLTPM